MHQVVDEWHGDDKCYQHIGEEREHKRTQHLRTVAAKYFLHGNFATALLHEVSAHSHESEHGDDDGYRCKNGYYGGKIALGPETFAFHLVDIWK